MTELHCVNTHTAQADGAVAAALPPAQQSSSTILIPTHPLTPSVLSSLPHSSARELLSAGQTGAWASLPALNLLQGWKKSSLVPDITRAAGSQLYRWEWKMWCALYYPNPWAEMFFWRWAGEEGEDKDFNCMFPRHSTAFDIQGLHLVQLMPGILKL